MAEAWKTRTLPKRRTTNPPAVQPARHAQQNRIIANKPLSDFRKIELAIDPAPTVLGI
jgi:hypothetical protein